MTAMHDTSLPSGPGLFAITDQDGSTRITNVRRLAGFDRKPGSTVIAVATWLLAVLAAGLLFVSFAAQFQYVFGIKHETLPAIIEALAPDAAMVILSALGIGLALAGKASKTERFLIVSFAALAAGMNYAASDAQNWRSVVAYVAPPLVLAVITDRVISVIRRHVLPDDTESAWSFAGRAVVVAGKLTAVVLLYSLRTVLAPRETVTGLRRMVLDAAPVPGVIELQAVPEIVNEDQDQGDEEPPADGSMTKKARFLGLYRAHKDYGDRTKASQVAGVLAPFADLQPGTARTYAYEEIDRHRAAIGGGRS